MQNGTRLYPSITTNDPAVIRGKTESHKSTESKQKLQGRESERESARPPVCSCTRLRAQAVTGRVRHVCYAWCIIQIDMSAQAPVRQPASRDRAQQPAARSFERVLHRICGL